LNQHPIHTNVDYASKKQYQKILVVGTLFFSFAVGLTVADISGKAVANLSYVEVLHVNPIFIAYTIYSSTLEQKKENLYKK
jgi:acyl dehydratase